MEYAVIVIALAIAGLAVWQFIESKKRDNIPKLPDPHSAGYVNSEDLKAAVAGVFSDAEFTNKVQSHLNDTGYLPKANLDARFKAMFASATDYNVVRIDLDSLKEAAKSFEEDVRSVVEAELLKQAPTSPSSAPTAAVPTRITDDELQRRITTFMEGREPDAVTKVELPQVKPAEPVTIPVTIPLDPSDLESKVEGLAKSFLNRELASRSTLPLLREIVAVIKSELRPPIEAEATQLREYIEKGLEPLEQTVRECETEKSEAKRMRLKANVNLRELHLEVQRHVKEKKTELGLDTNEKEMAEAAKYEAGRDEQYRQREERFEKAVQALEEAKLVLTSYYESTDVQEAEERLSVLNAKLALFDGISETIGELDKVVILKSGKSLPPPTPPRKPKAVTSEDDEPVMEVDEGSADIADESLVPPPDDSVPTLQELSERITNGAELICPSCEKPSPADRKFCGGCGTKLPE